MTVAEYQEMEAALQDAIAVGARKVKWGNKETEYHSLSEMKEMLEWIRGELKRLEDNTEGDLTVRSIVPIDS